MRIALISEHASPLATIGSVDAGGQNVYVAHLAHGLARAGHHVDVLTRRDDAALPAAVDLRPGVRVLHIDAGPPRFVPKERLLLHMPAFARASEELFRHSVPYDVVHANFFMSGLVGMRLKQRFATPLVQTFHALGLVRREHQREADAFPAARIDIERSIVRHADRVVAECPQDRVDLMRLYDACEENIATVPCGVDVAQFRAGPKPAARRKLGLAEDEFVVLQLGRLVPRKGIDNVIRALALLDRARKARLVVVGGDAPVPDECRTPEIARLRDVARCSDVDDRVSFIGHRQGDALRDCYSAADVFVTTPWYEPFGITPLEAMACARPVVGSRVGGIQYSVLDGVTGYLVPPHDPHALADKLAALQANPALAQALGRAGMRRVRSMFTWDRIAAAMIDVYQSVLAPMQLRRGGLAPVLPTSSALRTQGLGARA